MMQEWLEKFPHKKTSSRRELHQWFRLVTRWVTKNLSAWETIKLQCWGMWFVFSALTKKRLKEKLFTGLWTINVMELLQDEESQENLLFHLKILWKESFQLFLLNNFNFSHVELQLSLLRLITRFQCFPSSPAKRMHCKQMRVERKSDEQMFELL